MNIHHQIQGFPSSDSTRFLTLGPLTLDLYTRNTVFHHQAIAIPPCTFDYLVTLTRHAPEAISYKDLVYESRHQILGKLEAMDLSRVNIYMLRRAMEPEIDKPRYILTVAGYGYKLALE
jgi:DNA-binding response OmpR family regulator